MSKKQVRRKVRSLDGRKENSAWASAWMILSAIGTFYIAGVGCLLANIGAPDPADEKVEAVKLESWRIPDIGKELEEKGYVKSGLAFFARAQLGGKGGSMTSGTYYLSRSMDADKVISIVAKGSHDEEATTWVRIREGDTIEDIADKLVQADVIYDRDGFLEACKSGAGFVDSENFRFLKKSEKAPYQLEGYLYPDTYEFYFNQTPASVIEKMLKGFANNLPEGLEKKAKKLGYSLQDVIRAASIIEKEASADDFTKASAVIYNRFKADMYLQCDSTIRYVLDRKGLITLNQEQYEADSPYNSYRSKGLMPSPICSPSLGAIEAAVNPDARMVKDKYLYFCSTDNQDGGLVFARTYEEHLENVKKYQGSWKAYDAAVLDKS